MSKENKQKEHSNWKRGLLTTMQDLIDHQNCPHQINIFEREDKIKFHSNAVGLKGCGVATTEIANTLKNTKTKKIEQGSRWRRIMN